MTAVCGQSPRLHVLPARQAAPVWRGRPTEEQEAGVEGEGGGEDEGGEGDAVGDKDGRKVSPATWADTGELSRKQLMKHSANSCFVCLYFLL